MLRSKHVGHNLSKGDSRVASKEVFEYPLKCWLGLWPSSFVCLFLIEVYLIYSKVQVYNVVFHNFYRLYSVYSYKILAIFPVLCNISVTKQIPYLA